MKKNAIFKKNKENTTALTKGRIHKKSNNLTGGVSLRKNIPVIIKNKEEFLNFIKV